MSAPPSTAVVSPARTAPAAGETLSMATSLAPGAAAPTPGPHGATPPGAARAGSPPVSMATTVGLAMTCVAVLALGLVLQLVLVSPVQHARAQQVAYADLRSDLARVVAPTGQVGDDGLATPLGTPVAVMDIPALGQSEVVLEGTSAQVLEGGPGHSRDTVLPGQPGVSVLYGRAWAYGGPFRRINELVRGDEIVISTGQGRHTYEVRGLRRAGDLVPVPPEPGEGRLTLVSAEGPVPYLAEDVVRVDAELVSEGVDAPARVFGKNALLPAEAPLATDPGQWPTIMLWSLALAAVALASAWAALRWGRAQAWVVGSPVVLAITVGLGTTVSRLLPNLT